MRFAIALSAALMLAGCGDGQGEAVEAGQIWMSAVAERQPRAACEVMTVSATRAIRSKYVKAPETAGCEQVVAAYARLFDAEKLQALEDGGLEAGEPTPDGRVGVFPAAAPYDTQILLMQRIDGDWRVVSVGIPPRG